jgi:hypothetical protein
MKTPEDKTLEEKSRTAGASGKGNCRNDSLPFNEKPFHLGWDLCTVFMTVMSLSLRSYMSGVCKGKSNFTLWSLWCFSPVIFTLLLPFLSDYYYHIFVCLCSPTTFHVRECLTLTQTRTCCHLTENAQVQSQRIPSGICGTRRGNGTAFLPTSVFSCQCHFNNA